MRTKYFYLLFFAVTSLAFGAGGRWAQLTGEITISKAPLSDPDPRSPPAVFFSVDGAAAKSIYEGMVNPKVEANACGDEGATMKTIGDLVCSNQAKVYKCNFGVGLSNGKSQPGFTC